MTFMLTEQGAVKRICRDIWYDAITSWCQQPHEECYLFTYVPTHELMVRTSPFASDDDKLSVKVPIKSLNRECPWLVDILVHVDNQAELTHAERLKIVACNCWMRNGKLSEPYPSEIAGKWEVWYQLTPWDNNEVDISYHYLNAELAPSGTLVLKETGQSNNFYGTIKEAEAKYPGFQKRYQTALALDLGPVERLIYCAPSPSKDVKHAVMPPLDLAL